MSLLHFYRIDLSQGRMSASFYLNLLIFLCPIISASQIRSTPWFCTDTNALDPTAKVSQTLPECSFGYAIDIDDVVYESTVDGTCSGSRLCSINNKNTLTFACNHKLSCDVDPRHFRFHINSTCGSTVRFFTKYRCLPVIQESKDYVCDSPNSRRPNAGDINLSCPSNYRLHIKLALVGISTKPADMTRKQFKCNKNTYWFCNYYIPDAYRNVCDNQVNRGTGEQCYIRYGDRPTLRGCEHGSNSNFSIVEYSCVPGERISEDLPRFDICSTEIKDQLPVNRGLLHSPGYPYPVGRYLTCKKQLNIQRESRLRLFLLEKSIEYSHEFNIRLLKNEPNIQRTLAKNEMFDTNITQSQHDEIVEIELKTNHLSGGNFLLYFQVDSRLSEYAPMTLETDRQTVDSHRRGKISVKRDWGIVIGVITGLLLVLLLICVVVVCVRISKHRRARALKYLQNDDDHQNTPKNPPIKAIQIEHPHFHPVSATSRMLPESQRTNVTSSIPSENHSDHESLLQRERQNHSDADQYLEPQSFRPSKPIRDHHENEARYRRPAPLATPEQDQRRIGRNVYDAPMASTETLDVGRNGMRNNERNQRPNQAPPKVPPPRMDLHHPKPSAPPLHLLDNQPNRQENLRTQTQFRQHPHNTHV